MAVKIDKNICDGCPDYNQGRCERICPGSLISKQGKKAKIIRPEECWDCAACVKACPRNAISLYLPEEVGGRGTELKVQQKNKRSIWIFDREDGSRKVYKTG
ncbi:dissimilatory adenylylsulfate reductase beta subunit [Halanaerobium saccharolyticum]|uniref:Dissimilatory adenylylsulfate reductase beta subunit n=1 Tax=Halanaerobium saccharolyticum TaxID=43595 RepID=A0A2T5RLI5_9FIRM|nr:4Fe-4S dicluster domain-containing protein [Halanaerobium saccharolyticum]PTW00116.1 dissimilatory adenylylsulfate reductase beta subunit [Halanaerobium saccharolyticum]